MRTGTILEQLNSQPLNIIVLVICLGTIGGVLFTILCPKAWARIKKESGWGK